ncbi:mycofactocin system glycosyltransferase [Amycolatopsis rubida]|uniref:Mycofactocin system glycosyltransferase n=1 Tax=Amycolatopsis rubida TaxID=112413 RepID=A0ABX0BMF0_9PSEU|nr:mycofactocin biosynthesis glycosyltransferase MftF [Amycolatopsis sp. M39]MYW90599.1 mycofactocin system glycosyltransferase [Amycolatopsis rubida]NEC55580.1 mycofactocin system glycosyltransferase [Amycolatopsis rubida]OAP29074.1 Poly-beta-1,6-N-acetyl-D-glucosamine synthase [Amycolatopsis sp. M39]
MTTPLPAGFRLAIDPSVKQLSDGLLFGGSPARVLRLRKAGRTAWTRLADNPVETSAEGVLARLLTDAGFAHPLPPAKTADATVVIPVRDRAELLGRCLAGLDGRYPALVVDDGSADPAAIAAVASAHGAKLVRRDVNGGPGAARNTALEHVSTDLIAFLDSDCVPSPDWIDRLAGHFADPLAAAVAPRVRPLASGTWAGRYTRAASSLDLGAAAARVAPGTRLSYVPTAALLVRRTALDSVARDGAVFDPAMRVGEDVDLGWRLHDAGFRIRYDPSAHVGHHEPATWRALLGRRASYGTSAAPLALRRPGAMAPLVLHPWPTLTVAALLARRPLPAAAAFAGAVLSMARVLRQSEVPTHGVQRATATAVGQTWLGSGRYSTQFAAPLLAALLLPGGRKRWGRRAAIASLLAGPPLAAWLRQRPDLDLFRYTAGAVADDLAYGAGVWAGCLNHRTAVPLRPRVTWRPLRVDPKGKR